MRISDWSLDVCSSDLSESARPGGGPPCPCRGCDRRSFLHAPGLDFTDDRARQARLVGRDELVAHRVADGVEEAAAAIGVPPALEMEPDRTRVVWDKSGTVRVTPGARGNVKKKKNKKKY